MRVLAVAQAFKESLSATSVATAMGSGIRSGGGSGRVLVASDGGDGLTEALSTSFVRRTSHDVAGPLGRAIRVEVGWLTPEVVLVESRLVCGLSLVSPADRNPMMTTTRGVGVLIAQLGSLGAREVIVGLGGSATMDGGLGMARAWGWKPLDSGGRELPEGGGSLGDMQELAPGVRPGVRLIGLVDVQNPLTGPGGAMVYAAQKGAGPVAAESLAAGLENLVSVAGADARPLAALPGAGAAGGLGFGMLFFGRGALLPGARWVLDRVGFGLALKEADFVLCGEGAFDRTSLQGKLTGVVLEAARQAGIPAGLLAPRADDVPQGVLVETGGGHWTAEDVARRVTMLVERALRTSAGP